MMKYKINQIKENKKRYLPLLLLADEQEDMIDRYLDRGELFVLEENQRVITVCVTVLLENGCCEVKNLATEPDMQGHGYGRAMLDFICAHYHGRCPAVYVGTGDSPLTIPFYEKCGFVRSHRIDHFFIDHYDHPIFEAGVQLVDMIYLKKEI
jgi:GNAT superfamily N-acetyltransferase